MKDSPVSFPNVPAVQDLAALQAQMQRPVQNVNIDGGFELGWGMALLCFGLVPYLNAAAPKFVWTSAWTAWIGYVPLICAVFAVYGIPKMIKRFITWPRTGYVANPNDVKLSQLIMLIVFGSALGSSIALPFVLVSQIREALSQPGARSDLHSIIVHCLKLLLCVTLVVYLGRKVIRKRQPVPAAYDAAIINEGLSQNPKLRKRLRLVKLTMLLMFAGIPILVCGVVFGLMYMNKSVIPHSEVGALKPMVIRHAEIHWSEMGFPSFLVGMNALLYLMSNAVALTRYRWKWLVLAVMLIGPIVAAPAIPYPAAKPELIPSWQLLPPVMLSVGLVWLLSGASTLIAFIRHNPPPATEAP